MKKDGRKDFLIPGLAKLSETGISSQIRNLSEVASGNNPGLN
jgi:hypothetical protein